MGSGAGRDGLAFGEAISDERDSSVPSPRRANSDEPGDERGTVENDEAPPSEIPNVKRDLSPLAASPVKAEDLDVAH